MQLAAVDFDALPGWVDDDHRLALATFARSADPSFQDTIASALGAADPAACRGFFESHYQPYKVTSAGEPGLVTGYYEMHLAASREPTSDFRFPIYRRPPDLVNLVDEALRGAHNGKLTHARLRLDGTTVPYPDRAEIEAGSLAGQGLELAWVANPIELFFLHVQGSGVLEFAAGDRVRIGYDGKNGHPYTSIGGHLVEAGLFTFEQLTMPVLAAWLEADIARALATMSVNRSYIFFGERDKGRDGPLGVADIVLTAGRSLAVDGSYHTVGTPIFLVAPDLPDPDNDRGFARLMVAQDAGSAIRGPERGDIYFGSGPQAGARAGTTKNFARFYVLQPRPGFSLPS